MTFENARNPSVAAEAPQRLKIKAEPQRLPVGSQLNGLDDILEAARRRGSLAMQMG